MPDELLYDLKSLLQLAADDDEQSFRRLFDHYKQSFHSTAYKMTHSVEISNDIVQEVFITLWVKRKLIANAKKPEQYIFTILQNSIFFHFRKLSRERILKSRLGNLAEAAEDLTEIKLFEKEEKEMLENVIGRMPPQQRTIYKLARQEGLSREEIARNLSISPHTVRNHLAAAVQFLQRCMKNGVFALAWLFIRNF